MSTGIDLAPAPVRIVHLGLGAFHRAHQAWYTSRAGDAAGWGIAAFTGRQPEAARILAAQDGLYTLIDRSAHGDNSSIVSSIVEAVDGSHPTRLAELLRAPRTAVVTTTVTEAGYRMTPGGNLDLDDPELAADIQRLRSGSDAQAVVTAPARLLLGLGARRRAGGEPLAIVPCDNMPSNGLLFRTALLQLAGLVDPTTARWMEQAVSFVSTSVDRITPRTTPADEQIAAEQIGFTDRAPVVTEPFSDWVLAGDFPAGRPDWESAGARFVADIEPFERRKLWLLNGAHSLLAYLAQRRGHVTVAQAIADHTCHGWVEDFWDEAGRHLPVGLDIPAYRSALLRRFGNSRIEHSLKQISAEGLTKLQVRVVPVARAERAAGRSAAASARVLAGWIMSLRSPTPPSDSRSAQISAAGPDPRALVRLLDQQLGTDPGFLEAVQHHLDPQY